MKKIIVALAILATSASSFAHAAQANLHAGLRGSMKTAEGDAQIYIETKANGKVSIVGSGITAIEAEPVVVEDHRGSDGDLILKVGAAQLVVGSGFNPDHTIPYILKMSGQTVNLSPVVYMDIR